MVADEDYEERKRRNDYGPNHAPGKRLNPHREDGNGDEDYERRPSNRFNPPRVVRFFFQCLNDR